MAESSPPATDVIKAGFLTKQGGGYRNWKKRWCVLNKGTLAYYIKKGDNKPKNTLELKEARGVRDRKQCAIEDWPNDAKCCFGVALSNRTWYFYGTDSKEIKEWMQLIQEKIKEIGKPSKDWQNDSQGKPETAVSKAVRGSAKKAVKLAKKNVEIDTGNEYLNQAASTGLDMAENQLDADPNMSAKDRLKMAGGDAIDGVAEAVDNEAVTVLANVAKDQLDADEDLSLKQRLALAGGSAVEGVGDVTGIDAVNIAGGVIKDQATADEDASWQERLAIGVSSTAGGIKESSDDPLVHGMAKIIEKETGNVAESYAESSSSSSSSSTGQD